MKNIALCVYSNSKLYEPKDFSEEYNVFYSYNPDKLLALKESCLKKRMHELENNRLYDICIAFNPIEANINNLNLNIPEIGIIYYAYGYFNSKRYIVGGNPSLFYSKSLEFNRACEFVDNINNMSFIKNSPLEEKFIYHIRSMFLKDECFNYENSSLFIRSIKID